MNDWVSLGLGSVGGALVSEGLKLLITEAKKVLAFVKVSKELASTMESILPIITQIESAQNVGELENLKKTIGIAVVVVRECSGVKRWDLHKKSKYTRKVEEINKDMLKFCQVELQLLQLRNQVQSTFSIDEIKNNLKIVDEKLDLLSVSPTVFTDLCAVPKLDKVIVGLDLPLKDLKKKLLDSSVDRLVVSAPPGCGKTTLVTQLCHDKEIKGKFKHIFFNVVSSAPNFKVLVQNLLQHNGYAPVTFENDYQAKVALRNLLEKLKEDGPILLVLDDVWHGADFLLENFRIDIQGYKILVTSRFAFQSFGSTYQLEPLEGKDARDLLVHWASGPDDTSPDEYEELLQKILKRCGGFPIVIEVVGVSLKGRSLNSWKGQVESWYEGETILDNPRPTVLECLQPSFNALDPNLKTCFMDMGLFLEDQKIRASVLDDIWVELYGKGSSLCMKYLEDLASQNLLTLVPLSKSEYEDDFCNLFVVTQHDMLRELAISQSKLEVILERKGLNLEISQLEVILERKRLNLEIKEDKFPDWCLNLRQPINARLLSISTDDSFSSKWEDMDCPNVEVLVLHISSSDYALPSFIARMTKLKVLTIINHGIHPTRLSNFKCLSSLPSLKRIRLEKTLVTFLDIPQLRLKCLKKLSLIMCRFGEVFYDSEEIDVCKALPSLQEIDIDYCYGLEELPYWISEVVSLKTLSITNCYRLRILPGAIGNLSNLEVLRLSSCIILSELPETSERLVNLRILDISNCREMRTLPLEIGKLWKLKKIAMKKCWRCDLPDSVKNLENLEVALDEDSAVLWKRLEPVMSNLILNMEGKSYMKRE